jgi:outer membrane protein
MPLLKKKMGKKWLTTWQVGLFLFCFQGFYGQEQTRVNPVTVLIDQATPISLAETQKLAEAQVSAVANLQLTEKILAEDIKQAKADLRPKTSITLGGVFTSPSLSSAVTPRPPSFIGADAIGVYQALIGVSGEIDTSGKLKATLKQKEFLLESAKVGTEIARRNLRQTVTENYFNLALTTARRRAAENNLQSAKEFEANTKLLLDAGEVAPVDLMRAKLQTTQRQDELEQSIANESTTADALKVLIGYDFSKIVTAQDLLTQMPEVKEIESYTAIAVNTRPEFAQFEADRNAAQAEEKLARSERKPQLTYSVNGGAVTDAPWRVQRNLGVQATVGVTIPLFDNGASRSRETQARLKAEQAENTKKLSELQFIQQFTSNRTLALSAASRVRLLGNSIADAEKNVSASLARYQAGEASIVEVTDAQNTLINQKSLFFQAIYDYHIARSRLLQAIGK